MAEEGRAPAAASAIAPKENSKKSGPGLNELIIKAVAAYKERSGVSAAALKMALAATGYDVQKNRTRINNSIKTLMAKGILVQASGVGASGSYKINKNAEIEGRKPSNKRANKAKKPAAAKSTG